MRIFNLAAFIGLVALTFSCGASNSSSDENSNTNSVDLSGTSFICDQSSDSEKMVIDESALVTVNGKNVSVAYNYVIRSKVEGEKTIYGSEIIDTKVNEVFDFNRVSDEYIFVLTTSATMNIVHNMLPSKKEYSSLLVEVREGTFLMKDSEDKKVLQVENCVLRK